MVDEGDPDPSIAGAVLKGGPDPTAAVHGSTHT